MDLSRANSGHGHNVERLCASEVVGPGMVLHVPVFVVTDGSIALLCRPLCCNNVAVGVDAVIID